MKNYRVLLPIGIIIVLTSVLTISLLLYRSQKQPKYKYQGEMVTISNQLQEIEYYYDTIGPTQNDYEIEWAIPQKEYSSQINGATAYLEVTREGEKLEEGNGFILTDYWVEIDQREDLRYMPLNILMDSVTNDKADFSWDKNIITNYTLGCEECTDKEWEDTKDSFIYYSARLMPSFEGEDVVNSGDLVILKKNQEGDYKGAQLSKGESYIANNATHQQIPMIQYSKLQEINSTSQLLIFGYNDLTQDTSEDEKVIFTNIRRVLYSVTNKDSNTVTLFPVFIVSGKQGDTNVFGFINLFDTEEFFSQYYLTKQDQHVYVPLSTEFTLDQNYNFTVKLPEYHISKNIKLFGWELPSYTELEIYDINVAVSPERIMDETGDKYVYINRSIDSDVYNSTEFTQDKITFSFQPENFWKAYRNESGFDSIRGTTWSGIAAEESNRDPEDNVVNVQYCLEFNDSNSSSTKKLKFCDPNIYSFELAKYQ